MHLDVKLIHVLTTSNLILHSLLMYTTRETKKHEIVQI
jgi:hypothetical protein